MGRNRRAEQKGSWRYRAQRWVLFSSAVTLLGLTLGGAAWAGKYLLDLPVERLVLRGEFELVSQQEVEDMLRQSFDTGFLQVDLAATRQRLETLPWVYRAAVNRRWPDAIEIHVTEQQPIARWGLDGFLSHQGDYFPGAYAERWQHLARLEGPPGSEGSMTRRYRNLEALLAPMDLEVYSLTEDALGQVTVELDSGLQLRLGAEDHAERIRRFLALMQGHLADGAVAIVDMRYEHGAAVTFDLAGPHQQESLALTQLEDTP